MGKHARIEPGGYITIDTTAWLEGRTGGPDPELTGDLRRWAATHTDSGDPAAPDTLPARQDWLPVAQAWCQARGHEIGDPDLIAHAEARLDTEVWILRATVGERYNVAVVGINHDQPTVYSETPHLDTWNWFDADSVEICCPTGHGWTWRNGRELITAGGSFTTLTMLFGPDLDAPFTPCPHCLAHERGQRRLPCGCDRIPWVLCPTCGARCEVELPTY